MTDGTQTEQAAETTEQVDPKVRALAKHLDCKPDDVSEGYRDGLFEHGSQEYLVLTDEEADAECKDNIRESAWAFNISFLRSHVSRQNQRALEALDKVREKSCEDANPLVLALIEDFDHFAQDAIGADGRGHFLNTYDGHESDETIDGTTYYIYRIN